MPMLWAKRSTWSAGLRRRSSEGVRRAAASRVGSRVRKESPARATSTRMSFERDLTSVVRTFPDPCSGTLRRRGSTVRCWRRARTAACIVGLLLAISAYAHVATAQRLPVSDPLVVSGTKTIPSMGRLYFGGPDHPYEYDPAAASASGRGLTRALPTLSTDWDAFLRTDGNAVLPLSGGTRDGKECFRGLRRYHPNGDEVVFTTQTCLMPEEFPAVLAGADDFHVVGRLLYYTRHGLLYVSDGTAAGTRRVQGLSDGYTRLTTIGDRVIYVRWYRGSSEFYELSGSSPYPRYLGSASDAHIEGPIVQLGAWLYAVATDAAYGKELWRFDPNKNLASVVADLTPGPDGSNPAGLTVSNGAVYVYADGPFGNELYRADDQGMTLVRNIHPTGSAAPRELTAFGDRLYFRANDGLLGEELWETDGTEAGTRPTSDLLSGSRGARPNGLAALGDALYFWADDGLWGESLWSLRGGKLALIEATALTETDALDGRIDTWPPRYDARAIRDRAGDVALQDPIDLRLAKIARTPGGLQVGYEVMAPFSGDYTRHKVFFDVDRSSKTGWLTGLYPDAYGADYMLEGIVLYRFTSKSNSWEWEPVEQASYGTSTVGVELRLGVSAVQAGLIGSRVLLLGVNPRSYDFASYEAP